MFDIDLFKSHRIRINSKDFIFFELNNNCMKGPDFSIAKITREQVSLAQVI